MPSNIPFIDLYKQYKSIKFEIDEAISQVITESAFIQGKHVAKFETGFSKLMQARYAVSCANGTDSLFIILKSLKIPMGGEVICPANSWISTSETITLAGGKVVFCDIDEKTNNICTKEILEKITPNTVGIVPVHLYGHPCEMDSVVEIAKQYNLWIVEDCAQAHLAEYKDKQVGTFGIAASFSFYPGKNLGAMGDAGAIISSDKYLTQQMTKFARHGGLVKGSHEIEGINSRLDGLQAAILNVKMRYIRSWTERRREIACKYLENISNPYIELPAVQEGCTHSWHLFVIKTDRRDEIRGYLQNKNIPTAINYPVALPFLPAYAHLQHKFEDFPKSFRNQSRILSLPLYPELSEDEIDLIINTVNKFGN